MLLFEEAHMEDQALNVHRLHSIVSNPEHRELCISTALKFRKLFEEVDFEGKGPLRYDLHYNRKPKHLRYTEVFASKGGIIVTPCDEKTAHKLYRRAVSKRNTTIDFAEHLQGLEAKYIQFEYPIQIPKRLVILPGSNLIEKTVNKEALNEAVDEGAFIKPHPLTSDNHIKRLQKEYGKARVIPKMYSGAVLAKGAEVIYSSLGSELALLAELLGKEVFDISERGSDGGGYVWMHRFLRMQPINSTYLNYLLNSPLSGVFFPHSTEEDMMQFLNTWQDLILD
jgi:hypothetical protein